MKQNSTIKNLFSAIFVLVVTVMLTTACNPKQQGTSQTEVLSAVDSAGYRQFLTWKDQQAEKSLQQQSVIKQQTKVYNTGTPGTATSTASVPAAGAKKKGWSNTAKGAVIGGVGGAVIGGVVNKKNRAAGAVIGGVTGTVTGVIIGHTIDKKQGRS